MLSVTLTDLSKLASSLPRLFAGGGGGGGGRGGGGWQRELI